MHMDFKQDCSYMIRIPNEECRLPVVYICAVCIYTSMITKHHRKYSIYYYQDMAKKTTKTTTKTTTTFVTACLDVYGDTPFDHRTIEWRYTHFRTLAAAGIPLCVYVDPSSHDRMTALAAEFPNIYVMPPRTVQQTWAHHVYTQMHAAETPIAMPTHAHPVKDTVDYLLLMHAKIEFVYDAIVLNPWNTDHFAWIDFSLPFLFQDVFRDQRSQQLTTENTEGVHSSLAACQRHLQRIAHTEYPAYGEPRVYMCGCRGYRDDDVAKLAVHPPLDSAHWRFFGGIFVGHRTAMIEFHHLCRDQFPRFLAQYRKLVWEINYWAWLEAHARTNVQEHAHMNVCTRIVRYTAEHNDTILAHFPEDGDISPPASQRLLDMPGARSTTYDYPRLSGDTDIEPVFVPSSASYVYDNVRDVHWLLTRYVNYSQDERGCYTVRDPHRHIRTRNVLSRLDPMHMVPLNYIEVQDPTDVPINPALATAHNVYLGVEDVRIYMHGDDLRFIGTTFEYSDGSSLRMLEGVIYTESAKMIQSRRVDPPNWTYCEKNWAPVPSMTVPCVAVPCMTNTESELYFVYKWSPMQIGKVPTVVDGRATTAGGTTDIEMDPESPLSNKLYIVHTHEISDPLFRRIKGSTTFTRGMNGDLVGVVHFSIEGSPRKYYHMLLSLDPQTLRPIKYSTPFYFDRIGIEFCIGFTTIGSSFHFWISRVDRDPMHICLPVESVPLVWEVV